MLRPRFRITSKTAKALMAIEADLNAIAALPLSAQLVGELRYPPSDRNPNPRPAPVSASKG